MKLQIWVTGKERTILVDDNVNLGDLVSELDLILPGGWKFFMLQSVAEFEDWKEITVVAPLFPQMPIQDPPPQVPWHERPWINKSENPFGIGYDFNVGTFNIEILK